LEGVEIKVKANLQLKKPEQEEIIMKNFNVKTYATVAAVLLCTVAIFTVGTATAKSAYLLGEYALEGYGIPVVGPGIEVLNFSNLTQENLITDEITVAGYWPVDLAVYTKANNNPQIFVLYASFSGDSWSIKKFDATTSPLTLLDSKSYGGTGSPFHPVDIVVDQDRCAGCWTCILVCPFGAMGYNSEKKKVFKCDLCEGDPQCVRFCEVKAVDYVNAGDVSLYKTRVAAQRIQDAEMKAAAL